MSSRPLEARMVWVSAARTPQSSRQRSVCNSHRRPAGDGFLTARTTPHSPSGASARLPVLPLAAKFTENSLLSSLKSRFTPLKKILQAHSPALHGKRGSWQPSLPTSATGKCTFLTAPDFLPLSTDSKATVDTKCRSAAQGGAGVAERLAEIKIQVHTGSGVS